MSINRLTKLRYEDYLHKSHKVLETSSKSKTFRKLVCDILYSFLDYYQHLGETPIAKYRGQVDILILQQFQSVYNKYSLNKPLSTLSTKSLLQALSASLTVMSIWYYATKGQLNIRVVNFKPLKNQQEIIQRIHQTETKIKKNHEKVIQFSLEKYQALFLTVTGNKKGNSNDNTKKNVQ